VPRGGTSISGTSGATTGASALTPADGAESRPPSTIVSSPLVSSVAPLPAAPLPAPAVGATTAAGTEAVTTSGAGATGSACPMSAASSRSGACSGASHSTPDGGSRSAADAGRPCHICGSASTTPRLPTPDPP
jgi:hypothetical protein